VYYSGSAIIIWVQCEGGEGVQVSMLQISQFSRLLYRCSIAWVGGSSGNVQEKTFIIQNIIWIQCEGGGSSNNRAAKPPVFQNAAQVQYSEAWGGRDNFYYPEYYPGSV
jgi:hypothetical protein